MTKLPQAAARTVIVRLRNFVGDVVLGLPALRLLEQHGYSPVLVGKAWAPALLEGHAWPVKVLPKGTRARAAQLRALRAQALGGDPAFDTRLNALVLPWSFGSALEMRLAGLRAVGYRHEARSLLLSRSWPMPPQSHALLNYWDLACRFLDIERPLPPTEIGLTPSLAQQELAEQLLARHGVHEPYVLICPFAAGDFDALSKTWPHFGEFARLAAARGLRLLLCPGPGEEAVAAERFPQALSLPGLNLGVYAALQRRAALVVSNDTGPGHLAAAVGARLLSVLGPTEPQQWAPWGSRVDVMRQHPGWWSPEQVLSRAEALMAGATPSGGAWPHCLPPPPSPGPATGPAMGESNTLPSGATAAAVDQAESAAIREQFYSKVTGKQSAQVKAAWSRLVFSGKATPPKELASSAEVKKFVAANPDAIGYVEKSAVDASVKAVLSVD